MPAMIISMLIARDQPVIFLATSPTVVSVIRHLEVRFRCRGMVDQDGPDASEAPTIYTGFDGGRNCFRRRLTSQLLLQAINSLCNRISELLGDIYGIRFASECSGVAHARGARPSSRSSASRQRRHLTAHEQSRQAMEYASEGI